MEEQTIIEILKYLPWGIGIPSFSFFVLQLLKRIHPYFETWKNYYTKLKEIQSNERIEKMKLKAIREENKPRKRTHFGSS